MKKIIAFIAFAPTKREAKNKFLLTSKADEGKGCLYNDDECERQAQQGEIVHIYQAECKG